MKYSKAILLGLIILGILVGGYLSLEYSGGIFLEGALVGGLFGVVLYYMINWAVSRRKSGVLPYDRLDERHQFNNSVNRQAPEARFTGMQDALMQDFMGFKKPPGR